MMLLIGFLARSHYWSQDSIKANEGHVAGSLPSDQAPSNTISVDVKLDQVAFNKLDKEQKDEGHVAGSLPSDQAPSNTISVDEKLDQFAFNKLDKKQKAELLVKFKENIEKNTELKGELENNFNIKKDVFYIKVLKAALDGTSNDRTKDYCYEDYLKMCDFIDGNKEGGFSSFTPSPR